MICPHPFRSGWLLSEASPPYFPILKSAEELKSTWKLDGQHQEQNCQQELVFFFFSLEKSSWCLTEQKKWAGLKQDPALQVCEGKLVYADWVDSRKG